MYIFFVLARLDVTVKLNKLQTVSVSVYDGHFFSNRIINVRNFLRDSVSYHIQRLYRPTAYIISDHIQS